MPFRCRNSFYLRISESSVLPLFLYLDDRHLDWMSDKVLQHVIADLRPTIVDKLKAEAKAQSGSTSSTNHSTVDTHRGDTYQFCYFLRKAEPHSVLLKTRKFVAAPPRISVPTTRPPRPESQKKRGKRKATVTLESAEAATAAPKKRKVQNKETRTVDDDEIANNEADPSGVAVNEPGLRRSGRSRRVPAGGYREGSDELEDMNVDSPTPDQPASDHEERYLPVADEGSDYEDFSERNDPGRQSLSPVIDIDLAVVEEEEKPKPVLEVTYRGFNIFGRCLCVVVEPWPSIQYSVNARATAVAPIFQSSDRASVPAKLPLFLPDDDEASGPAADPRPFPMPRDPVSDEEEEEEYGGMVQFSQILNTMGDRAGAADDNEEIMGDIFTNDADEMRE